MDSAAGPAHVATKGPPRATLLTPTDDLIEPSDDLARRTRLYDAGGTRASVPAPLQPRGLVPGARVALVAPAGPLPPGRIDESVERCRALGLEAVVYPSAPASHRFLAGTDAQRLEDVQDAFDDPENDAVWALRGGYGTQRIVDRLDLARQLVDPIPFIGFSDNTALHARHAMMGVISFHGPHAAPDFPPETERGFRSVVFADGVPGALKARPQDPQPRCLVAGRAEGRLLGGNLAMMASLCGTRDMPDTTGAILFLEDVGEPAYRIDRMLLQLQRADALAAVGGLAFGRFTTPADDDGSHPVGDVLTEYAEALGIPAVADLPFGHVEHNSTLPVGGWARLDASASTLTLTKCVRTAPKITQDLDEDSLT